MIPVWIILALSAAALIGFSHVADKAILNQYLKPKEFVMIYIFRILFIIPLLFFVKISFDPVKSTFFFFLGILFTLAVSVFAKTLNEEEVSRVAPTLGTSPLIVMILSAIFFNEIFTTKIYIGIVMVTFGVLLMSYHLKEHKFNIKTECRAFSGATLYAIIVILIKYFVTPETIPILFFWFLIGSSASAGIFWLSKKDSQQIWEKFKHRNLIILLIATHICTVLSYFANIGAITLGPATLATTLYATTPFFVLIFATFSSIFFKKYMHEDVSRFTIIQKIIAIAIVLSGITLVI
jgi:drug/metabolite transporter (DMT)-like permease